MKRNVNETEMEYVLVRSTLHHYPLAQSTLSRTQLKIKLV